MTEYEMASLVTDMQAALAAGSIELATIVSGFLVAGYVAAHRLSRLMIAIVLGVYTFWFFGAAFILSRQFISLSGLVTEIHNFATAAKGLQWHAAAGEIPSEWMMNSLGPVVSYFIFPIMFAGSVVFFFHCRRVNRKAEIGEASQV
jgi:hypothetical protein